MRIAAAILVAIGLALCSAHAAADTYYKYRDKRTGRDVFVNRLDQVPQKYRGQAQVVLEAEHRPSAPDQAADAESDAPATPPEPRSAPRRTAVDTFQDNLYKAMSGKSLMRDGPAVACAMLDLKLISSGARRLTPTERSDFSTLLVTLLIATIVAGVAALVAWIAIVVIAVRDDRAWWALFIFIFSPLGYLYLIIHGGPGRILRRSLCAAGMLAPVVVGLIGAWRFYAFFQMIMQTRGVRI